MKRIFSTGETTQAVPDPKISRSRFSLRAVLMSSIVIFRSVTLNSLHSVPISIRESLVTPGRINPLSRGGVASSSSENIELYTA